MKEFVANKEITDEEAIKILVYYEWKFDQLMREPPEFMEPMPKDKKRMKKKREKLEPTCNLTGTIESRNRVDGHIHMVVEDAVLSQPGSDDIQCGKITLLVADDSERCAAEKKLAKEKKDKAEQAEDTELHKLARLYADSSV